MCPRRHDVLQAQRLAVYVLCVAAVLLTAGCAKQKIIVFTSESEDPFEYVPGVQWAVIMEPIVAFRETSSFESSVKEHARRGDVFQVKGKRLIPEKDENGKKRVAVWYDFDDGWLDQNDVSVYTNRMQAERAASKILKRSE